MTRRFYEASPTVAGLLPPGETEGPSALCRLTKILIPSVLAPAGGILPTSADTLRARPGLLPLGEGCCSFPGSRSQTCSLCSSASGRPYTVGMTPVPCASLSPPITMARFRIKKGRATNPAAVRQRHGTRGSCACAIANACVSQVTAPAPNPPQRRNALLIDLCSFVYLNGNDCFIRT